VYFAGKTIETTPIKKLLPLAFISYFTLLYGWLSQIGLVGDWLWKDSI